MTCPTCNLLQSDHTEDMAANCAVFIISPPPLRTSEAESAPGGVASGPPADPPSGATISIASVLLGWCNDIKRELEEFANDGPVGPMVPYRLEAGTREDDLFALLVALTDLIETLVRLRRDVDDAYGRLRGLVF